MEMWFVIIDNGKISTYLISVLGIVFAYILAKPEIMQPVLGVYYSQFLALVPLLLAIYNFAYPRVVEPVEQ